MLKNKIRMNNNGAVGNGDTNDRGGIILVGSDIREFTVHQWLQTFRDPMFTDASMQQLRSFLRRTFPIRLHMPVVRTGLDGSRVVRASLTLDDLWDRMFHGTGPSRFDVLRHFVGLRLLHWLDPDLAANADGHDASGLQDCLDREAEHDRTDRGGAVSLGSSDVAGACACLDLQHTLNGCREFFETITPRADASGASVWQRALGLLPPLRQRALSQLLAHQVWSLRNVSLAEVLERAMRRPGAEPRARLEMFLACVHKHGRAAVTEAYERELRLIRVVTKALEYYGVYAARDGLGADASGGAGRGGSGRKRGRDPGSGGGGGNGSASEANGSREAGGGGCGGRAVPASLRYYRLHRNLVRWRNMAHKAYNMICYCADMSHIRCSPRYDLVAQDRARTGFRSNNPFATAYNWLDGTEFFNLKHMNVLQKVAVYVLSKLQARKIKRVGDTLFRPKLVPDQRLRLADTCACCGLGAPFHTAEAAARLGCPSAGGAFCPTGRASTVCRVCHRGPLWHGRPQDNASQRADHCFEPMLAGSPTPRLNSYSYVACGSIEENCRNICAKDNPRNPKAMGLWLNATKTASTPQQVAQELQQGVYAELPDLKTNDGFVSLDNGLLWLRPPGAPGVPLPRFFSYGCSCPDAYDRPGTAYVLRWRHSYRNSRCHVRLLGSRPYTDAEGRPLLELLRDNPRAARNAVDAEAANSRGDDFPSRVYAHCRPQGRAAPPLRFRSRVPLIFVDEAAGEEEEEIVCWYSVGQDQSRVPRLCDVRFDTYDDMYRFLTSSNRFHAGTQHIEPTPEAHAVFEQHLRARVESELLLAADSDAYAQRPVKHVDHTLRTDHGSSDNEESEDNTDDEENSKTNNEPDIWALQPQSGSTPAVDEQPDCSVAVGGITGGAEPPTTTEAAAVAAVASMSGNPRAGPSLDNPRGRRGAAVAVDAARACKLIRLDADCFGRGEFVLRDVPCDLLRERVLRSHPECVRCRELPRLDGLVTRNHVPFFFDREHVMHHTLGFRGGPTCALDPEAPNYGPAPTDKHVLYRVRRTVCCVRCRRAVPEPAHPGRPLPACTGDPGANPDLPQPARKRPRRRVRRHGCRQCFPWVLPDGALGRAGEPAEPDSGPPSGTAAAAHEGAPAEPDSITPYFDDLFRTQGIRDPKAKSCAPPVPSRTRMLMSFTKAMLGRFFFTVGQHDNWQVATFFKGLAETGKSVTSETFLRLFRKDKVLRMGNNVQKEFNGAAHGADADVMLIPEFGMETTIDQLMFQSMVTGEGVVLARKHLKPLVVDAWRSHIWLVGNRMASNWVNNSGSLGRRLAVVAFDRPVPEGRIDLLLDKRLARQELGNVLFGCVAAYNWYSHFRGQTRFWDCCPKQMRVWRERAIVDSDTMKAFVGDGQLVAAEGAYMPLAEFKRAYHRWCSENGRNRETWTADLVAVVFKRHNIREVKDKRPYPPANAPPEAVQQFLMQAGGRRTAKTQRFLLGIGQADFFPEAQAAAAAASAATPRNKTTSANEGLPPAVASALQQLVNKARGCNVKHERLIAELLKDQ